MVGIHILIEYECYLLSLIARLFVLLRILHHNQHRVRHQYSKCFKILVDTLFAPFVAFDPIDVFFLIKTICSLQFEIPIPCSFTISLTSLAISFNSFLFHLPLKISILQALMFSLCTQPVLHEKTSVSFSIRSFYPQGL